MHITCVFEGIGVQSPEPVFVSLGGGSFLRGMSPVYWLGVREGVVDSAAAVRLQVIYVGVCVGGMGMGVAGMRILPEIDQIQGQP